MTTHLTPALSPDVAIVGGGVSGSSLAIVLRRRGLDVVLIERSDAFHDRIRGETVHPWGTSEMRRLDLYDLAVNDAQAQPQLLWQTCRDREIQTPYRWADDFPESPNGLGVGHVALQNALIEEAARLGVTLLRPASVSFARTGERAELTVTTGTGTTTLRPRLVVGADGQRSATRTWIGGTSTPGRPHHHIGGALIHGLGLESDRIHQVFFEGGFVLVSPQANDIARLYLVIASLEAMAIQTSDEPARRIVDRFRDSLPDGFIPEHWESIGPVGFFSNESVSVTLPSTHDVVLIGDASGRNDPSQGHGLSLVFHDIRILGEMLADNDDWGVVPDQFHHARRRYFDVLRRHAEWNERQATETGPEIDELRERIARARELDPTAAGFSAIFAIGPDNLDANEDARRHYLGEDLVDAPIA